MELNITFYLNRIENDGSTTSYIIYTTTIDNEEIEIEKLDDIYTYECETDFTVNKTGQDGHIYSNGQILYVKGSRKNDLRGSSTYQDISLDLTQNLTLDIKIRWETGANPGESITNKMVRVSRMF
jgi:hypothetical protein